MAGISIEIDNMFPLAGMIGGIVGYPTILSIIDISIDKYILTNKGNNVYNIKHSTNTQRFIVPFENVIEM